MPAPRARWRRFVGRQSTFGSLAALSALQPRRGDAAPCYLTALRPGATAGAAASAPPLTCRRSLPPHQTPPAQPARRSRFSLFSRKHKAALKDSAATEPTAELTPAQVGFPRVGAAPARLPPAVAPMPPVLTPPPCPCPHQQEAAADPENRALTPEDLACLASTAAPSEASEAPAEAPAATAARAIAGALS